MTTDQGHGAPPAASRWTLAVLILVVFVNQIGFGVLFPLQPFYAKAFEAPAWQITLMFAVFSLGQFVGELFWGRLSDRIGRRTVLLITMFMSAVSFVVFAYAPNIWIAIIVRGVAGVFAGNMSAIQAYVVDASPPERLQSRIGLMGMAFASGIVVGPSLGGLLTHPELGVTGYRLPLLAAGGLSLTAALGVLFFVREVRSIDRRAPGAAPGLLAALLAAARDGVLGRMLLATFMSFIAISSMWSTIGLWGEDRYGWGPQEVGFTLAASGALGGLAQGFSGAAVRRLGDVRTIIWGLAVSSLCLLGLMFSAHALAAAAAICAASLAHALAQPSITALISRAAPEAQQGALLGANTATGALGRTAGPFTAGFILSGLGAWPTILMCVLAMAPAAWLAAGAGRALRR